MKYLWIVLFLTSCTTSLTFVETEGNAENKIEESETNSPDIHANVKIPLKAV